MKTHTMSYSYCFFFKQKTAYEIPKRDWSSDVCSSDLRFPRCCWRRTTPFRAARQARFVPGQDAARADRDCCPGRRRREPESRLEGKVPGDATQLAGDPLKLGDRALQLGLSLARLQRFPGQGFGLASGAHRRFGQLANLRREPPPRCALRGFGIRDRPSMRSEE